MVSLPFGSSVVEMVTFPCNQRTVLLLLLLKMMLLVAVNEKMVAHLKVQVFLATKVAVMNLVLVNSTDFGWFC